MRPTALACCLALAACASSVRPAGSGFLGGPDDYARMEPSSRASGVWVEPHSGRSLGTLQMVIVDPVAVVPAPGSSIGPANAKLAADVAAALHAELERALGNRYPVVRNPGQFTVRIRAAITDIDETADGRGRGATMEAEILDSRSGERIAAILASDDKHGPGASALDVVRGWAEALRARIDAEHLGE